MSADPTLDGYFTEVARAPLLSKAEANGLAWRVIAWKDQWARQKLIESNLRFVIFLAKKYRRYGLPLKDLIAEGNIGLIRAVDKFDPIFETRFTTYAKWWIREAIHRAIQKTGRIVSVPAGHQELAIRFQRLRRKIADETGRNATVTDVARRIRKRGTARRLRKALEATATYTYPLDPDSPVAVERRSTDQRIIEQHDRDRWHEHLDRLPDLLAELDPLEAKIIKMRHGLNGTSRNLSFSTIADRTRLSISKTRAIYENAIGRLRITMLT